ncbi:MAG TPA: PilZ domain-containing protein [Rhizomicrobium sp.]|nr:PilZ domain-containing protein [Rhizomicrobium sp.]HWC64308.1 PilZ domain-containing protein [Rhizomicrobium sp.]
MSASPFAFESAPAADRRVHPRRVLDQDAQFVIPGENMAIPCRVVNISAGGAKITCDAIPQPGSKVLLILTSGECFEAVTARYGEGELALKFTERS